MIKFMVDYGLFFLVGVAIGVFGPLLIATFWNEVLMPSIYGPNGTWQR